MASGRLELSELMISARLRLVYAVVFTCLLAIFAHGCTGCMTTDPEKFKKKYEAWVPNGTPVGEAERIMKAHGFECRRGKFPSGNPWSGPILICRRENGFLNRTWIVNFFLEGDRVVGANEQIFTDFLRTAPRSSRHFATSSCG